MTVDTEARQARTPRNPRAVIRGLAAVAGLFLGAADSLVTAWLGIPRLGWLGRRVADITGDTYRRRAWDSVADAEVVEDAEVVPGDAHHQKEETRHGC